MRRVFVTVGGGMVTSADLGLTFTDDAVSRVRRVVTTRTLLNRRSQAGIGTVLVSLAEMEQRHILGVLQALGGNKKAAAECLGIDRSTLYAKLRLYEKAE